MVNYKNKKYSFSSHICTMAWRNDGKRLAIGISPENQNVAATMSDRILPRFTRGMVSGLLKKNSKILIYETQNYETVFEFETQDPIVAVQFSNDNHLVVATNNPSVKTNGGATQVIDVIKNKQVKKVIASRVNDFIVASDEFYVSVEDGNIVLRRLSNDIARRFINFVSDNVISGVQASRITAHQSTNKILVGADDTYARVCIIENLEDITNSTKAKWDSPITEAGMDLITDVCFLDSKHAFTASKDNSIRLWELNPPKKIQHFEMRNEYPISVSSSSDGRLVGVVTNKMSVYIWNIETGEEVFSDHRSGDATNHWFANIEFAPAGVGNQFAVCMGDQVRIYHEG